MNIPEAISRLQFYIKYRKPDPDDNFHESVQLGIESLKRVSDMRTSPCTTADEILPGETEE